MIKLKKLKKYKKIRITHEETLEDKILGGRYKPIRQDSEELIIKTKTPVSDPDQIDQKSPVSDRDRQKQ